MQKTIVAAWVFLSLFNLNLSAQKSEQLFNGKNLKNWYAFNTESGKHKNAADLFRAEDGMIRLFGAQAGYLMSRKSYANFTLTAEFRWNMDENVVRKNNKMNSGLMYLVPETTKDTLWPQGIQFQIKEGASGDFILLQEVGMDKNGTIIIPGKSVVVAKNKNTEKTAGEWNNLKIQVKNGTISQFLNGELVNQGNNPTVSKGRILLQYEGFPIDFRNIVLQKSETQK